MVRLLSLLALLVALYSSSSQAQQKEAGVMEIKGDVLPAEIPQLSRTLSRLWLFPEDYEGKTVHLKAFLFEAENFERFPELKGYLFSCEPVVFAHNDQARVHMGSARHISSDKLNLFCSEQQGQAIRKAFKEMQDDPRMAADVTLQIQKGKDGIFLGVVTSFAPRMLTLK